MKLREDLVRLTGLTCSIGLGVTPTLARLATSFAKPPQGKGVYGIKGNPLPFLAPLPTGRLHGIGRATEQRLQEDMGVSTIGELQGRSERQIAISQPAVGEHTAELPIGPRQRIVYVTPSDLERAKGWMTAGYTAAMRTPENTLIFVEPERENEILTDQINCMGCLSQCSFSNWAQNESGTTGLKADPRSFCIQKTLQSISHSDDVEHQLMFAGHNAYRFGQDPFYSNGFVPTVKQLVDRIASGE